MGTKLGESADLFDVDTGKWVGALDAHGREQIVPTFNDDETALVGSDGGVLSLIEATPTKASVSASDTVHTGAGEFAGYNVNSFSSTPTLTVYDNTAGSGKIIYGPVTITTTGPVFLPRAIIVETGVYAAISGTLNITPYAG